MSNAQVTQYIGELFEASSVELFHSINSDVVLLDDIEFDASDIPHSHIDAGCIDIEIIIHLYLPFSTLAMTYPVLGELAIVDETAMEDWICELSNRLMGKLKNRLSNSDIELAVGLPSYSIGAGVEQSTKNGDYFIFTFELYQQTFAAGISIEVFNDSLILKAGEASNNTVADGDIEFF